MTAGRHAVTVSAMTFIRRTRAAIVMVAVFAILATLRFADDKQWRAARVTARGADAR
jgi:hypothetical protein